MKFKILSDVYEIANRIKDIDENYFIVFNTSNNKFEIHNSAQLGTSYCLTLPFKCLDERALKYVRKTSCANIDEILEQIDNDNNTLKSTEKISALNSVCENVENILRS